MTALPTFDEQMSVIRHIIYRLRFDYHDFHNYTICGEEVCGVDITILKDSKKLPRIEVKWPYAHKRKALLSFTQSNVSQDSWMVDIQYAGRGLTLMENIVTPNCYFNHYNQLQDCAFTFLKTINGMIRKIANMEN